MFFLAFVRNIEINLSWCSAEVWNRIFVAGAGNIISQEYLWISYILKLKCNSRDEWELLAAGTRGWRKTLFMENLGTLVAHFVDILDIVAVPNYRLSNISPPPRKSYFYFLSPPRLLRVEIYQHGNCFTARFFWHFTASFTSSVFPCLPKGLQTFDLWNFLIFRNIERALVCPFFHSRNKRV